MGFTKIIELGTGVNAQIIATSPYWRYELWTGIVLLCLILPLTYLFTKSFGIIGPPLAALISTFIYNTLRIYILWKKYSFFPFTHKTILALIIALISYICTYYIFRNYTGFWSLTGRTILFSLLFIIAMIRLKISPDIEPIIQSIFKKKSH